MSREVICDEGEAEPFVGCQRHLRDLPVALWTTPRQAEAFGGQVPGGVDGCEIADFDTRRRS